MNKFKNRNAQYPNRRKLNIKNIGYKENGDISELLVDVERSEGYIYEEGTELSSEKLETIVRNIVNDCANDCIENFINTKNNEIKEFIENICEKKIKYHYYLQKAKSNLEGVQLMEEVTEDFILPSKGREGYLITWESLYPSLITIDGNVARVTRDIVFCQGVLVAQTTCGTATFEKKYEIVVKPREATDSEKVEFDTNNLSLSNEVETTFELPIEGYFGSSIQWSSNSPLISIIGNFAVVTREYFDQNVLLKAIIKKGDVSLTKAFKINVKGTIGHISDNLLCIWTQRRGLLKSQSYTITSNSNTRLCVEIDVDSDYISASVEVISTKQVRFTISETEKANLSSGNGVLSIPYTIKFYNMNVDNQKLLIGSVPGEVKYYRASTTPDD